MLSGLPWRELPSPEDSSQPVSATQYSSYRGIYSGLKILCRSLGRWSLDWTNLSLYGSMMESINGFLSCSLAILQKKSSFSVCDGGITVRTLAEGAVADCTL